jgi:starch phosphorylase
MRLFMDEHDFEWEQAWEITHKTFAYTNHTLLPEALEKWSVGLFASLLPRHLEIIYEINRRFLRKMRAKYPGNNDKIYRLSLIDEAGDKYVRRANLACVGSHAINGVAALHTELLKQHTLHDFYELLPEKFSNKTNGVTPRRWMVLSNPLLTELITSKIGKNWIKHLDDLGQLEAYVEDAEFQQAWRQVKYEAKQNLVQQIQKRCEITVNPNTMFDIQVKRIHEYKRQHLNVLHIITLYNRIKQNPNIDIIPRTFIFAGKAALGYFMAKLVIKLINSVAEVINNDPDVDDRLKLVFIPDYNVTNSQPIYPAADLSEQISTAGKEASAPKHEIFLEWCLNDWYIRWRECRNSSRVGEENFFLVWFNRRSRESEKVSGL